MKITDQNIVGELVAADYRTAEVFSRHKIDFCCKGDQTIAAVCAKKNISSESLLSELNRLSSATGSPVNDYNSWPLDLLTDYIEKKHHRYVSEKTPVLLQYLNKVSRVHGEHNPELRLIAEEFHACASALAAHMKKEELILFPFIRKMVLAGDDPVGPAHFGSVENPIDMMKIEHEAEGERFRRIAHLSNNYTPPEHACNTYRVTYSLLKEFEQDLHLHIHLENNILFPKALAMESQSRQSQVSL
jgi:regulator of cell morphogenesis and NO signaling